MKTDRRDAAMLGKLDRGGGLTPIIAEQLVAKGGLVYVGYYLSAAAALSLIGLLALRRSGAPITE